jgi:hypothetical protein
MKMQASKDKISMATKSNKNNLNETVQPAREKRADESIDKIHIADLSRLSFANL